MKNIFQNKSIKKAAAAGMIAAQVSMGTNFLSDSFVDNAFAETNFYSSWNSSVFGDLVPNYSGTLDVSGIANEEDTLQKTRCVLDSDKVLNINPKAYSVSRISGPEEKLKYEASFFEFGFANKIEYSALPSAEGLFAGVATNTFAFGPNHNSDVSISVALTSPNPGVVTQLTPDSFNYTPNPAPTFDYATGTYSATNGLGDTVNGVLLYNNSTGPRGAVPLTVNNNSLSALAAFESDVLTDIAQSPSNGTIINNSGAYYYQPNLNYAGQDFFTIRNADFYVSVLKQNPSNGFEGGNFTINAGDSSYYAPILGANFYLGHFRFYKEKLFNNTSAFAASMYKLEAPTTTFTLPQFQSNGLFTSFIIDTLSSFYGDFFKTPDTVLSKQFTVVVEHKNRAPVTLPLASSTYFTLNSTGTADVLADYSDLEIDTFTLRYDISNDNFATIYASTTKIINLTDRSTSTDAVSFTNLPIGDYQLRTSAVETTDKRANCLIGDDIRFERASSTSAIKNFTVSNTIIVPPATTTPTTTPVIPLVLVSPQGGLLPLTLISPEPTLVASNTAPTTTEVKIPVKEVLGLNPEDSDDLLPGETPAAYLIRMEKRRVLGKSGSRNLVNTGSNATSSLYVGAILLSSAALLFVENRARRNKGEVKD